MLPEVSILTVYYNAPEHILALHQSMQQHLPLQNYEWIVADNHSLVDLSGQLHGAAYMRFSENYGFAKANNLASQKAVAPFLFFLNPDTLFIDNPLPNLMDRMKRAAVVAPKVLNEDGTIQLSFGPFLSIGNEFLQRRRMQKEKDPETQKWISSRGEFSPDYVSGCALMIRADLFRQLGGFDENFFLYEEDVDLCKRVKEGGERILYVPEATVVHGRNKSVLKTPDQSRQHYRRSQRYYYQKHHGFFQNLLLRIYHCLPL